MTAPRTRNELIEALAAVEHARWSAWTRYQLDEKATVLRGDVRGDLLLSAGQAEDFALARGDAIFDAADVAHWRNLAATPYADLPEHSKHADRDEVARSWPLLVSFVEDWIERDGNFDDAAVERAARWQREMTATDCPTRDELGRLIDAIAERGADVERATTTVQTAWTLSALSHAKNDLIDGIMKLVAAAKDGDPLAGAGERRREVTG